MRYHKFSDDVVLAIEYKNGNTSKRLDIPVSGFEIGAVGSYDDPSISVRFRGTNISNYFNALMPNHIATNGIWSKKERTFTCGISSGVDNSVTLHNAMVSKYDRIMGTSDETITLYADYAMCGLDDLGTKISDILNNNYDKQRELHAEYVSSLKDCEEPLFGIYL